MWWIVAILLAIAFIVGTAIAISKSFPNKDWGNSQDSWTPVHQNWDEHEIKKYGAAGENYVSDHLLGLVKHFNGLLFNDFCFEDNEGYSSEIDHIVVTRGGIFVIETKTNKGTIIGSKDDEYWQCIKKSYQEDKVLKNPIKQNLGHINHLRKMFGNNCHKMESIIIFPVADISNLACDNVYNVKDAVEHIKQKTLENKYSEDFVKKANSKLIDIKIRFGITKEEHIKNIRERIN